MSTPEYRFLCDVMLRGLGRWLRAAGYDTRIAESTQADRELVREALTQQRLLLTRDRKILEIRNAKSCTCFIATNALDDWVCELNRTLALDWCRAAFSRCMLCNTPLEIAPQALLEQVPEQSREHLQALLYCPQCQKPYWEGSHVRRMRARLQEWNQLCKESASRK
jgi:hypothetical protein